MTGKVHPAQLGRVTVSASVGSNALTLTLVNSDGSAISSTNPAYIEFPSGTASSGIKVIRKLTSPVTLVVSSGSTLGHSSAILQHFFVYLIDNGGTVEMAVSNLPPDYPGTFGPVRLISTTAEGGAGAADSATGIYSTTARSNVPWVPVAMCKSTQTTAGTWAAVPSQIDPWPFKIPSCSFSVYDASSQSVGTSATRMEWDTEYADPDATYDASTNYRHQPNVAGLYTYLAYRNIVDAFNGSENFQLEIRKNNSAIRNNILTSMAGTVVGNVSAGTAFVTVFMNGTSDYIDVFGYHSNASSRGFEGGSRNGFTGHRLQ